MQRRLWLGLAAGVVLLLFLYVFVGYARGKGPGTGARHAFEVPSGLASGELADRLVAAGYAQNSSALAWYLRLTRTRAEPGRHLLRDDLSPRELAQRLARSPGRASVKVTIPEGWHHRQIAERLADLEVCPAADFIARVFEPALLRELELRGPSAEGFLFPATYDVPVDSDPAAVIRPLVAEAKKRLARVAQKRPGALDALKKSDGFDEHDVVTLASIVEREAADPAEHPLIASVFFNRLHDPTFRPLKTLESDPTAGYGCLVEPALAPSCAGFRGQVTPALLRDARNRYNTYRHPGLPPGPIANPGEHALDAVLAPAVTDYLYFVASGGGRHTFSKTFAEHRNAIVR
ncbi:MAG TPA: endolytic transglycosylase MltG [Polyangiaceae bacterium]|nr:endolytic transglycosylase MltG [Polyangiaceae bacterium]